MVTLRVEKQQVWLEAAESVWLGGSMCLQLHRTVREETQGQNSVQVRLEPQIDAVGNFRLGMNTTGSSAMDSSASSLATAVNTSNNSDHQPSGCLMHEGQKKGCPVTDCSNI